MDSRVGAYNILSRWQRFDSLIAPSGSIYAQEKHKRSNIPSNIPGRSESQIKASVSCSDTEHKSRNRMKGDLLEMKMIQKNVVEARNKIVEEASAVQMEMLTDLTTKV